MQLQGIYSKIGGFCSGIGFFHLGSNSGKCDGSLAVPSCDRPKGSAKGNRAPARQYYKLQAYLLVESGGDMVQYFGASFAQAGEFYLG